jgi:hypothetical protein
VVGTEMTLVGYGRQASDHITGIRRLARVTLESLSQETLVYNFHGEGACHGDSGGPAFAEIDGVWHQIGMTSWGDPSCSSTGHYQRLDVLAPWLESQRVPAPRALDCGASGCDGQCEVDRHRDAAVAGSLSRRHRHRWRIPLRDRHSRRPHSSHPEGQRPS